MRPGVCFWRSGSGEFEEKYADRRDRSGKNRKWREEPEVARRTGIKEAIKNEDSR